MAGEWVWSALDGVFEMDGLARVGLDGHVYMRSVNRMRGKFGNICRGSEGGAEERSRMSESPLYSTRYCRYRTIYSLASIPSFLQMR